MTGQERLDDVRLLETADPSGMLRQVASSAAQVRTAVRLAAETDLGVLAQAGRPRAIVVTGMGGSGVAGDVLAGICGPGCPSQIVTVHDYLLPGWVGAADLVIAVSCSGATEETLAVAGEAVRRGCPLIGVGGASSPLALLAQQARAPFVSVMSAGMPRSTLWGLSVPLLVIAERLGVIEGPAEAYESAAAELERISHLCRPDSEACQPGEDARPGTRRDVADDLGHLAADRSGRLPVRLPARRERQVPGGVRGPARGQPQPGRHV